MPCSFCKAAQQECKDRTLMHVVETAQPHYYQVVATQYYARMHWTGRAFKRPKPSEDDENLALSSLKILDSKWINHPLDIAIREVKVSDNGGNEEPMTIIAAKSAVKRWKICNSTVESFMLKEYLQFTIGVPFYVKGCVYIVVFAPSIVKEGSSTYPDVDKGALYEGVVKPFVGKMF